MANGWKGLVLAAPVLGLSVSSCELLGGASSPLANAACPELAGGAMQGTFTGEARSNTTIRAFVQASADLRNVADAMEAQVADACLRMGADLGVPPAQMAPTSNPGGRAEGACQAVLARIDGILRAAGNAQIGVTYSPPECSFAADAYASCAGGCNLAVDPGQIIATCTPGHLSGYCAGICTGSCDGTCNGQCTGACSARSAIGQCAGECAGTCSGQCSATCHAQCVGQWHAPRCDVDARAPTADAKCAASCKAHAELTSQCSPARVMVSGAAPSPDVQRVIATLQANFGPLVTAQIGYGKRLAADVQALGDMAPDLARVVGTVGAHAQACIGAAGATLFHAQASIRVTVGVSANVSGRVGAAG